MSVPVPARRAATAGSLALALALAAPVAAFADPAEEQGRGGDRSEAAQERKGAPEQGSASTGSRSGEQGAGQQGSGQQESGERASQRPTSEQGGSSGSRAGSRTGGDGAGARAADRDPRGNNGTVKIDGLAYDDGRGNEPHVGCEFAVDFYGFDEGDTASISLTGHAPTGGGLLHSQTGTLISDDAAGGGQDRDATLVFSVANQLSELLTVTPHPQQGWHVKLAVDVDSAPGGAKQKVFWIDCPQTPAVTGTTTGTTTSPATNDGAQDVVVGTRGVAEAPPTPTFGSGGLEVVTAAGVAGTLLSAAERADEATLGAARASTVSARGSVAPAVLPFTGAQGLLGLLGLGVVTAAAGAVAHRLGRRQPVLS